MSGTGDAATTRSSPVRREVLVMVAFAVFVGIGIATVLVPALTDDAHDEERATQGNATQAGGTPTTDAAGNTTAPVLPPDAPRPAPQPAPPTQPVGP